MTADVGAHAAAPIEAHPPCHNIAEYKARSELIAVADFPGALNAIGSKKGLDKIFAPNCHISPESCNDEVVQECP